MPALETDQEPSRLPPPPPCEAAGRRLSFGLLCFAGRCGAASRDPESDFSRLPMVPPMLPDCASICMGARTTVDAGDESTLAA